MNNSLVADVSQSVSSVFGTSKELSADIVIIAVVLLALAFIFYFIRKDRAFAFASATAPAFLAATVAPNEIGVAGRGAVYIVSLIVAFFAFTRASVLEYGFSKLKRFGSAFLLASVAVIMMLVAHVRVFADSGIYDFTKQVSSLFSSYGALIAIGYSYIVLALSSKNPY